MYDYGTKFGDKQLVAEMSSGGGYDWAVFGLFRDDAGRLYTAYDSGCSCYGPWENEPDFQRQVSIHTVLAAAREEVDGSSWFSEADYEAFKKEVLAL